jgi:hypothetical protein
MWKLFILTLFISNSCFAISEAKLAKKYALSIEDPSEAILDIWEREFSTRAHFRVKVFDTFYHIPLHSRVLWRVKKYFVEKGMDVHLYYSKFYFLDSLVHAKEKIYIKAQAAYKSLNRKALDNLASDFNSMYPQASLNPNQCNKTVIDYSAFMKKHRLSKKRFEVVREFAINKKHIYTLKDIVPSMVSN